MTITISRNDGSVIVSGDYPDIKTAVEDCARRNISLERAYLTGADLSGADLFRTNLQGANLQGDVLHNADLRGARLYCANLSGAVLSFANLYDANLQGSNLQGADLYAANLSRADLSGATLPDFQICPRGQSFAGYKKLKDDFIATLEIPADVPRTSSLVGRKCRAQSARIISIEAPDGTLVPEGFSLYDGNFIYRAGEVVSEPDYDPDIRIECTRGVHFFVTKEEARKY